ncbi:MAG: glycosyltransferase family 9 protein [Endomicrobiales bacterium]|jgi:lipopolysaccharide heptosyltransferase II
MRYGRLYKTMTSLLSLIGSIIIRCIGSTLRIRPVNVRDNYTVKNDDIVVFAFWHGDQFIPCYHHRNQQAVIMTSLSKDGSIQTGILNRLGYVTVRGSSTRGGERALVEAIRLVKKGYSASFAIDGPKGPFHDIKPGIVFLAQKTGRPLIPVSSTAKWSKLLPKTWDRYRLPLPFSPAVVVYGQPLVITPQESTEDAIKRLSAVMEKLYDFSNHWFEFTDIVSFLDAHPKPKILIIQPSRIGDVVFTLPSLAAIRKRYPHAWIGWVVDERCASILEGNPDIDEIIVFDRSKLSALYLWRFARELHDRRIDLSIDFHGLLKSAMHVLFAGARFKIASASTNGMRELSWLFSREIQPARFPAHCVERHLAVAHYLACDISMPSFALPDNPLESDRLASQLGASGIALDKPIIVVHPGGGWLSRRWFPDRFAGLINRLLRETGVQVILVGGKEGGAGEQGLNEVIVGMVESPGLLDLTGKLTLKGLAALLKRATVFVGNEAGPLHMATAAGTPLVAIIGPTDPGRTGPFRGATIVRHHVECQPCRNRSCRNVRCMQMITVDEVFHAVVKKLHEHTNH